MDSINDILNSFEAISLEELDVVCLLDRIDTKYVFSIDRLPDVLLDLRNNYHILEICGIRKNCYQTVYYDTDDFSMYHQHHNGKMNRYKVRLRRYCDSGLNYFEIKRKNNKDRTIKTRVKRNEFSIQIEGKSSSLLQEKTVFSPENLKPVVWVNYSRMTFSSKDLSERLTIDTGLRFVIGEKEKSYETLVIAEIKQNKAAQSGFTTLMLKQRIPSMAISKYCLGMINLYEGIKKNNFKWKILRINKIIKHDH